MIARRGDCDARLRRVFLSFLLVFVLVLLLSFEQPTTIYLYIIYIGIQYILYCCFFFSFLFLFFFSLVTIRLRLSACKQIKNETKLLETRTHHRHSISCMHASKIKNKPTRTAYIRQATAYQLNLLLVTILFKNYIFESIYFFLLPLLFLLLLLRLFMYFCLILLVILLVCSLYFGAQSFCCCCCLVLLLLTVVAVAVRIYIYACKSHHKAQTRIDAHYYLTHFISYHTMSTQHSKAIQSRKQPTRSHQYPYRHREIANKRRKYKQQNQQQQKQRKQTTNTRNTCYTLLYFFVCLFSI